MEARSTIVWIKDNIPVHTGQSMLLFIASVNRSQAGNYICVSLSPTGNRTSAITAVNVLCKYNAVKSVPLSKSVKAQSYRNNHNLILKDIVTKIAPQRVLLVIVVSHKEWYEHQK